jgi:hypothetical protein
LPGKRLGDYDYIGSDLARFQNYNRPLHVIDAAYPAQGLQSRSEIAKFRAIGFA